MVRSPTARTVDSLLRDLGPLLRRGGPPAEPPARFPTGIPDIDRLTGGGFPSGGLSEISGPISSGRTSLALALLARTTRAGAVTAVVDGADAFDPASADAAGARLDRVLWVRAPQPHEALRSTERLLEAHGFALVVLDLACMAHPLSAAMADPRPPTHLFSPRLLDAPSELPPQPRVENGRSARADLRLAPATWPRLARAAAGTGTALVVLSLERVAGTSAVLAIEMASAKARFRGAPALLEGLEAEAALVRCHTLVPRTASVRLHTSRAA